MLVNPYFPNNLRLFWLQNFVVPWGALSEGPLLQLAEEFFPLTTREFVLLHLAVIVPYAAAVYLVLSRPRKQDPKTVSLFLISGFLLLMSLMMRRFVEYAAPLTLLFLASFYTDRLSGFDLRAALAGGGRRRSRTLAATCLIALGLVGLLAKSYLDALPFFRPYPPMRRDAALYLKEHTEPDELVFTCDWDDAPELFFFNHRNRYPVMLDPNFMHHRNPELSDEWYRLARGGFAGRTYDVLARDYRYGVCTWDFERLKQIVERDPRMEIVLDSGGAYVFRVDRDNAEIDIEDFLRLGRER
jgi:hypothetical protein